MQGTFWTALARSLGMTTATAREEIVQRHITNLNNPSEDMRRSAAWQLGKMQRITPEAAEALKITAKRDSSSMVRKAAKWAMKTLNVKE